MRSALLVTAMLALSFAGIACKKPPERSNASPQQSAKPPDHLAPGELVEGKERAFALPLPVQARVSARTPTTIHVATPYSPEQLSNFVRSRVSKGNIVIGASKTTFDDVTASGEPARHLKIDIEKGGDPLGAVQSIMTVLDVTPPPPPDPNTTEEERFKKAGLKPNGQLLDPKHMQ